MNEKGLKVWAAHTGDSWQLLVAAQSVGRVKALVSRWDGWADFIDVRCQRRPQYDQFAEREAIWVDNTDLPAGAPDYWYDPAEGLGDE